MVVSGTVYTLMEFGVVIGSEQLSLLIMGDTEALTAIGRLIIFLSLLKVGWKVSTCVTTTPVKSFLYQTPIQNLSSKIHTFLTCLSVDEAH